MKRLDLQALFNAMFDETAPGWPVVTVDVDGVLNLYTGWTGKVETFTVAPGAREFLEELRHRFKTIVAYTATLPLEVVEDWLKEVELADLIDFLCSKPLACCYIDDRGIQHRGDFNETLAAVDRFVPHWQAVKENETN